MSCECNEWSASAKRVSGPKPARTVDVIGRCICTRTGHKLKLAYGNPGINPDRKLVVLDLTIEEPEIGHDTMTPETVEFRGEIGLEPERVEVRMPSGKTVTI